jgi:septal ring factor EnvC (AmiA/AmiB activator)
MNRTRRESDDASGSDQPDRRVARLETKLQRAEQDRDRARAQTDRLRETVQDLTARLNRQDARLRRIHRARGFRLLNALFRYDRPRNPETPSED